MVNMEMSLNRLKVDYTFLSDYVFCQEGFDYLRRERELNSQPFPYPFARQ